MAARPFDPLPIENFDPYEAVRQFIHAYAFPQLPLDVIIQGWQNRSSLPPGTNEFAVISIISDLQHGTAVETFNETVGRQELEIRGLVELLVQVDFCSEDDNARKRAQRLATITRSSIAPMFFNDYGMSALYSEDAKDTSFVGSENQFIRRHMIMLHLTINEGLTVGYDYFDKVGISRLENVEVHHPDRE